MSFAVFFLCPDASAAPLVGKGTVEIAPDGLRLRAHRRQTSLATSLSVVVALLVLTATVGALMLAADAHGLLDEQYGWELVTGLGAAALIASYRLTRRLLHHGLPTRRVETTIAPHHVVAAASEGDIVWIATSSPDLLGRVTFRTAEGPAVLHAVRSSHLIS